jgi:hypothetical protein
VVAHTSPLLPDYPELPGGGLGEEVSLSLLHSPRFTFHHLGPALCFVAFSNYIPVHLYYPQVTSPTGPKISLITVSCQGCLHPSYNLLPLTNEQRKSFL